MRTQAIARSLFVVLLGSCLAAEQAQPPSASQITQERRQAELDAPKLVEVLGLQPGMTIADVGAGGGAMSVVLGHWIGRGRVFATDITVEALRETREYAQKEGLTNVTVLEGGAAATNLPAECCDAIFLRHVYHHIGPVDDFNRSLFASLRPGGRLAIIDFPPSAGEEVPAGVPANRGGHGVPLVLVIQEMQQAGFRHIRTIDAWPPGDKRPSYFLTLFQK
jgi:ubiquinone/menaquinone biosynthesis C-methylase UbiE